MAESFIAQYTHFIESSKTFEAVEKIEAKLIRAYGNVPEELHTVFKSKYQELNNNVVNKVNDRTDYGKLRKIN